MTTLTKNIFYFSKDKENNFILNRKEQINIEFLDLISKFKNKYSLLEIQKEEILILTKLNKLIDEFSDSLVFLYNQHKIITDAECKLYFNNLPTLNKHEIFSYFFDSVDDYENYCENIGNMLTQEIADNMDLHLSDIDNYSLPSYKKEIIHYLWNMNPMEFNEFDNPIKPKKPRIALVAAEDIISEYRNTFLCLCRIKKLLIIFFKLLKQESINSVDILSSINIDIFFSQYEFKFLQDILYNLSSNKLGYHRMNRNLEKYPYMVLDLDQQYIKLLHSNYEMYFPSNKISFFNSSPEQLTYFIEAYHISFLEITNKIKSSYSYFKYVIFPDRKNNYIFVTYDAVNNKYSLNFNDSLIHFDYIKNIIDSLKYGYRVETSFLDNII